MPAPGSVFVVAGHVGQIVERDVVVVVLVVQQIVVEFDIHVVIVQNDFVLGLVRGFLLSEDRLCSAAL